MPRRPERICVPLEVEPIPLYRDPGAGRRRREERRARRRTRRLQTLNLRAARRTLEGSGAPPGAAMQSILDLEISETHAVLRERLERAVRAHHVELAARDNVGATDDFLASISRHLSAVSAVLLPVCRKDLDQGIELTKGFVQQVKGLEVALNQVKARLYGESRAMNRSWADVWADVTDRFEATLTHERDLVDLLLQHLDEGHLETLASGIYKAEVRGPTRPHPYLPHQGVAGSLARKVAAQVDHFYDATEGRMVPAPPRHDHRTGGLVERFLLADPYLDDETPPSAAARD